VIPPPVLEDPMERTDDVIEFQRRDEHGGDPEFVERRGHRFGSDRRGMDEHRWGIGSR